jgi:hypothetical protein
MIPDKKLKTPKRFNLGYWCRETAELFHAGWLVASSHMREYRQQQERVEDRKYIVDRLEWQVYTNAESATPEQKLEALKYFQRKKEYEAHRENRPYTWGEQLSSLVFNAAYLSFCLTILAIASTWACGSNQSQACKDIRGVSSGIIQYWTLPKD